MATKDPKDKDGKSNDLQGAHPIHIVRCPTCRKAARYDQSNPFRPFCSALCKNEDIIGWAEERFRVPGKSAAEDEDAESLLDRRPRPLDDDD